MEHLRFTRDEAAQFLVQVMGLELTPAQVAASQPELPRIAHQDTERRADLRLEILTVLTCQPAG